MSATRRVDTPWVSLVRSGRVVMIRLHRVAENSEELHVVTRFMDQSHRECGQSILVLALPAPGLTPPSEEIRGLLLRNIRQRLTNEVIEQAVLVIPKVNAFRRAIVRSIFTGARLVMGLHNRIHIFDDLEEGLGLLASRPQVDLQTILPLAQKLLQTP